MTEGFLNGTEALKWLCLLKCRLNEAQGQLQAIVAVSPDYDFTQIGTAHVRIFLRTDRGDDILVLRELLKELFPDDLALHSHMQSVDELRRWTESSDDWRTFSGLLRDLEGNCYEEAAQPPGLSVPLRPYQRQSLQFMLDSEKREGGLLSINYQPLQTNLTGVPLLYSASLNHLMPAIPDISVPTVRGGFLCEEMGLGKTIEVNHNLGACKSCNLVAHNVHDIYLKEVFFDSQPCPLHFLDGSLYGALTWGTWTIRSWLSYWQTPVQRNEVRLLPPKALSVRLNYFRDNVTDITWARLSSPYFPFRSIV